MVSAIVVAGGGGVRSAQFVPKQFLTVNDVPVIVYTMRNLQNNTSIDNIVVVGPEGWENFIYTYAEQFGVTKLKKVVSGGATRHASIYNGLLYLEETGIETKVCLVDANRPLIPESIISNVIALTDQCDCAMVLEPCYDSMFISEDGERVKGNVDRGMMYKQAGPECANLSTLLALYKNTDVNAACSLSTAGLAVSRGRKVLATKGHIKCFKITTADDFELFKAFLSADPLANLVK